MRLAIFMAVMGLCLTVLCFVIMLNIVPLWATILVTICYAAFVYKLFEKCLRPLIDRF